MLDAETVKNILKDKAEPQIYSRGLDYFYEGLVLQWKAENDPVAGIVKIIGKIEGSRVYETTLKFYDDAKPRMGSNCTCPYEDLCKHIVALGLTYAASLENKKTTGAERVRQALKSIGLSADKLPETIINDLLRYKTTESAAVSTAITPSLIAKRRVDPEQFDSKNFFITINGYNDFIPSLMEFTEYSHRVPSITKLLRINGLTTEQRDLLTYIRLWESNRYDASAPDPVKLFPLLAASNIPVYTNFYSYRQRSLTIDLCPKHLSAEIVYKTTMNPWTKEVFHEFYLRMPEEYWRNKDRRDNPFRAYQNCFVRSVGKTLELHASTPLLSKIIARMIPIYEDERYSKVGKSRESALENDEIIQYETLASDASRFLSLSSPAPVFATRAVPDEPRAALRVDFDNAAQTLRVAPIVNYGIYQQDVSENIFVSHRRNAALERRSSYRQGDGLIITVIDGVINFSKVDEKKELELYRDLAARAGELGFTKTLKCNKRNAKRLTEYLRDFWPKLSGYAKINDLQVIFTKDKLAIEQTAFKIDFNTDLNVGNDWLYFDINCYCGGERITLEKLLSFVENGSPYWRKDDGTMVEVSNRKELERLAEMLKGFHARENGGFEGQLHHAPELEYVMTSSPHYNSARADSFKEFLSRIQKGKPLKKINIPPKMAKILRPYQKTGIEWLYFLRSYRFAGILADEMGLGKTLQALSVLCMEKVAGKPSLVVCPKTLLYNWKLEAEKFFPTLKTLVYDGTPTERERMRKTFKRHDLVVVSYGTLKKDEKIFSASNIRFNYAVLDEAQFIKNHASKNAQIAKKINADYRLALTGTPLENNVSELWSIYDFLMPGFLGSYDHFAKNFHRPIMDFGDRHALEHLRRKIECFTLRRLKSEVLKELPPKIEQLSQCHLSEPQNILYQQILTKVRGDVFSAVEQKGFKSAQIHILAGLTKLRQACNHPALLVKNTDFRKYESAKLDMCMELVGETVESGRKALVFSQFTQMLDIVSLALKDRGIAHVYLSGKTKDRQSLVDKFNSDLSIPVFLISMKAGGTGLNLTAADTVIIFDPWWNPSVENQAIDRAHRIGQTKTVNVYRLLTTGTIEEKIQLLKEKKQKLFNAMVGETGDMFKKLTWDDIRDLFTN